MLLAVACALIFCQPQAKEFRVFFLGNSHTAVNDVPGLVKSLLQSGGYKVSTDSASGGHLDDIEPVEAVRRKIDDGKWTHVVLQGAMISSSHKYEYPLDGGIALAKRAVKAGAMPLYFAEWPQRGQDESGYIFDHYETMRKAAGGEVVPICYAWDRAMKADEKLDMWQADGNHAALPGSFLAACTIAYWIGGTEATLPFAPVGLDSNLAQRLNSTAFQTVKDARAKK